MGGQNCKGKKSKEPHELDEQFGADWEEEVRQQKYNKQELISHIKERTQALNLLRKKLTCSRLVLQNLLDAYQTSAGNCPCCRVGELESMIREALDEYSRKVLGLDNGQYDPDEEKARLLHPVGRLLLHTRRLSTIEHDKAEMEVRLSEMSPSELQSELLHTMSRIESTGREFSAEESHFKTMTRAFERCKGLNICKRYGALKRIIEDATEDCIRDS